MEFKWRKGQLNEHEQLFSLTRSLFGVSVEHARKTNGMVRMDIEKKRRRQYQLIEYAEE